MVLILSQKKGEKINIYWLDKREVKKLAELKVVSSRWGINKKNMLERSVELDFFTFIDNEHHYYWLVGGCMHLELFNALEVFLCSSENERSYSNIRIGYQAPKSYNIAREGIDRFTNRKISV